MNNNNLICSIAKHPTHANININISTIVYDVLYTARSLARRLFLQKNAQAVQLI